MLSRGLWPYLAASNRLTNYSKNFISILMEHEKNEYVRLPTANRLFHEAGKVAILKGDLMDVQTEREAFRRFVVKDFSKTVHEHWPTLKSLEYIPAQPVDGPPQDDMVWIIFLDDVLRRDFIISRTADDDYDVEVERTLLKKSDLDAIAKDAAGVIDLVYEFAAQSNVPPSTDILMLGRLIDELSATYDIKGEN